MELEYLLNGMAGKFKQGLYQLKNPKKYVGNPNKIRYLSSWEYALDQFFDNNKNILQWSSEPVAIPYIKPSDNKVHRYFPDYWIRYRNRHGEFIEEMIEVKPANQVDLRKKKRLTEADKRVYQINICKWESAKQFCEKRGITFRVLTEEQLFRQGGKNGKKRKSR